MLLYFGMIIKSYFKLRSYEHWVLKISFIIVDIYKLCEFSLKGKSARYHNWLLIPFLLHILVIKNPAILRVPRANTLMQIVFYMKLLLAA